MASVRRNGLREEKRALAVGPRSDQREIALSERTGERCPRTRNAVQWVLGTLRRGRIVKKKKNRRVVLVQSKALVGVVSQGSSPCFDAV